MVAGTEQNDDVVAAQYKIIAILFAVYFSCIAYSNSSIVPSSLHLRGLLNFVCTGIVSIAVIAVFVNRLRSYSIKQFLAYEVDTGINYSLYGVTVCQL